MFKPALLLITRPIEDYITAVLRFSGECSIIYFWLLLISFVGIAVWHYGIELYFKVMKGFDKFLSED